MRLGKEFVLNDIKTLKKFVNLASKYENDITIGSGRYYVNGKSILGLMSLDLTNPITVYVESDLTSESCRIIEELFDNTYSEHI